jgi:hypothetical protein
MAHYCGFSLVYIHMIEQYDSILCNIYIMIEIQLNNKNKIELYIVNH